MFYWGIDPGRSGAIAVIDQQCKLRGGKLLKNTDHDIYNWICEQQRGIEGEHACVIEKVWAFPKYRKKHQFVCGGCGVSEVVEIETPQGGSSTFKFGRNYGFLEGVLAAAGIPYREAAPMTWKKALGLTMKTGSTVTERKNFSKARAQQLFPGVRITHATAEALLLAVFCREVW